MSILVLQQLYVILTIQTYTIMLPRQCVINQYLMLNNFHIFRFSVSVLFIVLVPGLRKRGILQKGALSMKNFVVSFAGRWKKED